MHIRKARWLIFQISNSVSPGRITSLDETGYSEKTGKRASQIQIQNNRGTSGIKRGDNSHSGTRRRKESESTYVWGADEGFWRLATSRRDGGRGGDPLLNRCPLVSRASTVGKTDAKMTKRVKATTASLCMAERICGKEEYTLGKGHRSMCSA